jgi:hypothetical protein
VHFNARKTYSLSSRENLEVELGVIAYSHLLHIQIIDVKLLRNSIQYLELFSSQNFRI